MTEGLSLPLSAVARADAPPDLAGLVSTYSTLLFRVAHSVLRNRAEAEDTVQDTFLRVLEHRHKLGGIKDMRVWLVRICWNLALDRRRRIRPAQMDDIFASTLRAHGLPADQALAQQNDMRVVLDELECLPAAERQALLLSTLEELGAAEVASIMGKTESAVRALVFRARTRLKTRMARGGRV